MNTILVSRLPDFLRLRALVVTAGLSILAATACSDDDEVFSPPANSAPTAVVSADVIDIPSGDANSTIVTVTGLASSDPNGDPLLFSWSVPGGTFENGTNNTDPIINVSFPGTAVESVTLVVSDPEGASDSAQLTIGLRAGTNRAPLASINASPTTIPAGDGNTTIVTLAASDSLDPDGDEITFTWTVPNGTFVSGTDENSEVAQVTFPGTEANTVTLVVRDARGLTDSAEVTITLN